MSLAAEIEDAMLAALRAALPDLAAIEPLPDIEALTTGVPPAGRIYLVMERMDIGEFDNLATRRAPADLRYSVLVQLRNLRSQSEGARGCYDIVDAVIGALAGLALPYGGLAFPERAALVLVRDGDFTYGVDVVTRWVRRTLS